MFPDRSQQVNPGGSIARPVTRPDFGAATAPQVPSSMPVQPVSVASPPLNVVPAPVVTGQPKPNFIDLRPSVASPIAVPIPVAPVQQAVPVAPVETPSMWSAPASPAPVVPAQTELVAAPIQAPTSGVDTTPSYASAADSFGVVPEPILMAETVAPVELRSAAPFVPQPAVNALDVSKDAHEPDLESMLASFTPEPTIKQPEVTPVVTEEPSSTNPVLAKVKQHKNVFRATAAVAVLALVTLSGMGLYHGYTHDAKLISAAKPVIIVPAKDQLKLATANAAGLGQQSGDAERIATVDSLRTLLEKYFILHGYYPAVSNMQDLTWIANNFEGFDLTTLKDPAGSVSGILTVPAAGQYAYQAGADVRMSPCDNSMLNCNYYALTATLSNGKAYASVANR